MKVKIAVPIVPVSGIAPPASISTVAINSPPLIVGVVSILPKIKLAPEIAISRPLVKIVSVISSMTKLPIPSPSASALNAIKPLPADKLKLSSAKSCNVISLVACKIILLSPDNPSNSDS